MRRPRVRHPARLYPREMNPIHAEGNHHFAAVQWGTTSVSAGATVLVPDPGTPARATMERSVPDANPASIRPAICSSIGAVAAFIPVNRA